jgi:hypothetical protein
VRSTSNAAVDDGSGVADGFEVAVTSRERSRWIARHGPDTSVRPPE